MGPVRFMIAYIDPTPVPGVSAPALQIAQTVGALAGVRDDVVLVTPAGDGVHDTIAAPAKQVVLRVPGVRRRWFWPFASRRPFLWAAAFWVARSRPRLLYLRHLRTADYLARHFPSIPFVFEAHEVFWRSRAFWHAGDRRGQGARLAAFKAMEQRVYDRAAGVVTITAALADDVRNDFRYRGPLIVAPDGVDAHAAAVGSSASAAVPGEVLYLGSGAAWKGIETAIRAMPFVEGAHLRVVGPGGEAARRLSVLASELGVSHRVSVEPFVAPARRFQVIGQASVCLLPGSRAPIAERFTSPLKLFEYLACGRPVIAGDVPAVREILSHGETGWLTEVGNPRDLAAGLSRLLGDEALRQRLGAAGARLATQYDWAVRAAGLSRFLNGRLKEPTVAGKRPAGLAHTEARGKAAAAPARNVGAFAKK